MNILEWSEKLMVGVESVDEDHKYLFEIIRELFDACFVDKRNDKISDLLIKVIDYTKYHFAREEALMQEIGSPMLEFQIEEHRDLINKVIKFSQYEGAGLNEDFFRFMWNWLTYHILEVDLISFNNDYLE